MMWRCLFCYCKHSLALTFIIQISWSLRLLKEDWTYAAHMLILISTINFIFLHQYRHDLYFHVAVFQSSAFQMFLKQTIVLCCNIKVVCCAKHCKWFSVISSTAVKLYLFISIIKQLRKTKYVITTWLNPFNHYLEMNNVKPPFEFH